MQRTILGTAVACLLFVSATPLPAGAQTDEKQAQPAPVSYYRQVRPILQRRCSGCHYPAKPGGQLDLTSYEAFRKGGENGPAFVSGSPSESLVLDYISGDDPEMPRNDAPLSTEQVSAISNWIRQGAVNDTPDTVRETVSAEHPPTYTTAPVITALDYSPDSAMIAVSGYHEILLHKTDGSAVVGRLVGRMQRIESIAFSPDGRTLAAVGGTPALFGEVQIWDVATQKLLQTHTISHDTLFGASFSDDGKLLAFGAADNSARVIRVEDGKQVTRLDTHSDWVLDTAFSLKQDHLISVSRDQSTKLTIVSSGQFVDNITSITPGALKGGLMAVERHPKREQLVVAGADGLPRLYKIFRTRKRVIGDDFNHIRSYEKMPGRIFDVDFNPDGSQFIAGSSDATAGAAHIYTTGDFDEAAINNAGGLGEVAKQIAARSASPALKHTLPVSGGPVYAVAWRPDGKQVAVGGFDGHVRLYDAITGKAVRAFVPVQLTPAVAASK